jgi:type II secretory pathway component PulJ
MRFIAHRLREQDCSDDAGTSLLELVVGMAIMAIFMGIFTTAIVVMTKTASKVEAVTAADTQVNQAFLTLDKSVRYASAITTTGISSASGDWYVEFDTTNSSAEQCTQLRVDRASSQLQQRTWVVPVSGAPTASSWKPLASYLTNTAEVTGSSDAPFSVPAALTTATSSYQRLTITLVSTAGGTNTATSRSSMTFTALNSSATATTNGTKCQQMGRP